MLNIRDAAVYKLPRLAPIPTLRLSIPDPHLPWNYSSCQPIVISMDDYNQFNIAGHIMEGPGTRPSNVFEHLMNSMVKAGPTGPILKYPGSQIPALIHANPPKSPAALAKSYSSFWDFWAVTEVICRDPSPRFEHQYYGPYNTFFTSMFHSLHRRFEVFPQFPLRKSLNLATERASRHTRGATSASSMGGVTVGRGASSESKKNAHPKYPDILVSKIRLPPADGHSMQYLRVPLLVAEFKVTENFTDEDRIQLKDYMRRICRFDNCVHPIQGLLIGRNYAELYEVDPVRYREDAQRIHGDVQLVKVFDILTPGQPENELLDVLGELAIKHWNL
ncbi:hypothetical protein EIP91_010244 [Steccherinum ochraceum]|uniref:Uncharacterized protein n=1 Tax=Steccherinum ochraceum TaxID=92696 RepID=A0A4R0R0U2_9APHY|nr:hypothetical protein EIP91_010244 [Steccherinum ochraceum]